MASERLSDKFLLKGTAAAVAILAAAGIAVASKKTFDDYNTRGKMAQFSSVAPFANYHVPTQETQYIEREFKKFQTIWTGRQPTMRHVSLDLALSGKTSCESNFLTVTKINSNDINGMLFCAPENKVIITRAGINLINELSVPNANTWKAANATPAEYRPQVEYRLLDLVLAHELGHAAQLAVTGKVEANNLHIELQADCYAGQAYRDNDLKTTHQDMASLYDLLEPIPDITHGTAAQRVASFERGLAGEECT